VIRVGFSTGKKNVLSAVIRFFTGSKVSHAWLLLEDTYFGLPLVLEATTEGFRLIPYAKFQAKTTVIEVVDLDPTYPVDSGVKQAAQWLGDSYDFGGLLGSAFVLVGRWLKRKWKNPSASSKAMFCSEAVVRVLQASSYPGADQLDPEATTPQDLLDYLRAVKA
jgi:hypothetical protein